MTIHNWRHIDTAGGLALPKAQPTKIEYRPPDLSHVERLAHGGTIETFCRQARATQRRAESRRRIAIVLLALAAIVAAVTVRVK